MTLTPTNQTDLSRCISCVISRIYERPRSWLAGQKSDRDDQNILCHLCIWALGQLAVLCFSFDDALNSVSGLQCLRCLRVVHQCEDSLLTKMNLKVSCSVN